MAKNNPVRTTVRRRKAARSTARGQGRSRQPTRRAGLLPARLLQLGMGFWAPRAFLSAVELGLFTVLARGALEESQLRERLGLHARGARDFFDTLVALGLLQRQAGKYRNVADVQAFLDRNNPDYVGGVLEMAALRLYPFWGGLTEALRTGAPQNEIKAGGELFGSLYADPERLRVFLSAMTGVSMAIARAVAAKFPWKKYRSFIDVGGAQGCVPVQVARAHAHLAGGCFDLSAVGPHFEDYVLSFGLQRRLKFYPGDFWRDALPEADVLIMGRVLQDWNLEQKHLLLQKAYAALPRHGVLIVYDAMIDDARRRNAAGLLMSLNMLIETAGGFAYTPRDCRGWLRATGFRRTSVVPLTASESMVVATK